MSRITDGGPAFPTDEYYDERRIGCERGMSLRDWLAGQALAGWGESYHSIAWARCGRTPTAADIAATCYAVADAMLKAREQAQTGGRD
jgi:hypothetical protein